MKIRLAMLQMNAELFNVSINQEKAGKFCREAAAEGADIVLMPELFSVGYPVPDRFRDSEHSKRLLETAQPENGPFVVFFRDLARELKIAIGITYLERRNGEMRNSLTLVDRKGEIVGTYSKFHTCRFQNLEYDLTPGEDFYVWDLDTKAGTVRVGAMICYDREHPESARILMLKGAEIVLVPNACHIEEVRTNQLRTRGFENETVYGMANYAAPNQNGRSVICGFDGLILAQAGLSEQILLAGVDLEALRQHQKEGIWGISFRRPEDYGLLTRNIVRPGYGAKTAEERAKVDLPPVKGKPFEEGV